MGGVSGVLGDAFWPELHVFNELRLIQPLFVWWAKGPNGEPDPWPMGMAIVMVEAVAHQHTPAKSPNCPNVDGDSCAMNCPMWQRSAERRRSWRCRQ